MTAGLLVVLAEPALAQTVSFAPPQHYPAGDGPRSVISADFDGDGNLDLAVVNQLSDDVSVLLGNGDGTFAEAQNFPVGDGPFYVTSADFDGDGFPDLAAANAGIPMDVSVLINTRQPACTITGTEGADFLSGTSGDDVICGLGGDDTIYDYQGGDDTFVGGGGADSLLSVGSGRYTLFGEEGDDFLLELDESSPNDAVDGGNGRDYCYAGQGDTKSSCE